MAPLLILVGVTLLVRLLGFFGLKRLQSWHVSVRGGLAAMFTVTGLSHFSGLREDFVAMVPPVLPFPELLVTLTGILELLGAAGLLYRRTAPWAAAGLGCLLVAMFPANVYAAVADITFNDGPAPALLPRSVMQLVFIAATVFVVLPYIEDFRHRPGEPAMIKLPPTD